MKKQILMAGIVILLLATMNIQANAQSQSPIPASGTSSFQAGRFVDENKNGICDKYEARPSQGRGLGRGYGQGRNFVDVNKNGICDNHENGVLRVRGPRVVDNDYDGISDNLRRGRGNCWRYGWRNVQPQTAPAQSNHK